MENIKRKCSNMVIQDTVENREAFNKQIRKEVDRYRDMGFEVTECMDEVLIHIPKEVYAGSIFRGVTTGRISAKEPNISNLPKSLKDILDTSKMVVGKEYANMDDAYKQREKLMIEIARKEFFNLTGRQVSTIESEMDKKGIEARDLEHIIEYFEKNMKSFEKNDRMYEDEERCGKCKGKCCKKTSCVISPDDIAIISYEYIKLLIDNEDVSIDWNDIDGKKQFFLRVKEVGAGAINPSYGGQCAMLTDSGCKFKWNERPKGGRLLRVTASEKSCVSDYTKFECSRDWLQYSDILKALADSYRGNKTLEEIALDNAPKELLDSIGKGI